MALLGHVVFAVRVAVWDCDFVPGACLFQKGIANLDGQSCKSMSDPENVGALSKSFVGELSNTNIRY